MKRPLMTECRGQLWFNQSFHNCNNKAHAPCISQK